MATTKINKIADAMCNDYQQILVTANDKDLWVESKKYEARLDAMQAFNNYMNGSSSGLELEQILEKADNAYSTIYKEEYFKTIKSLRKIVNPKN